MTLAVIGAGVSGLTAAHLLQRRHDVTVFEQEVRAGGHSHTVVVQDERGPLAIDTGFIVYNERTYPAFTRLLARLGIATQPSEMSFAVTCERCAVTYSGRSVAGLFAQPRRLVDWRFARMLVDIVRFNAWARRAKDDPAPLAATLGGAIAHRGFSSEFRRHYLLPMTSAIWSASSAQAAEFPLMSFLTFFHNHGLLQLRNQPQWRTVCGGSRQYVAALAAPLGARLRLGTPVRCVTRHADHVAVALANGESMRFDGVVIAAHADQAARLLGDATDRERDCLRAIPYVSNEAVLHTDARLLPPRRRVWSSWNYHLGDCAESSAPPRLTYYMNRLQRLDTPRHYCVTLNDTDRIDPAAVLGRFTYDHPAYSVEGIDARRRLQAGNGDRRTFFCGAYLGNGFHEDGVQSALAVARALGVREDW